MKKISEKVATFDYLRPYITIVLLAGSVALACLYFFLMYRTIYDAAKMKSLSVKINDISVQSSDLEYRDLRLKSGVTLNLAYSLGYKDAQNPIYLTRKPLGNAASFNNELQ